MTPPPAAEGRTPPARRRFGDLLVGRGLVTPAQLAQALRVQAERNAKGVLQNLGQILVEQGLLTAEQIRTLLQEQLDQTIMICPACGERYNVARSAAGRAACPSDGHLLSRDVLATDIGVAATLEALPREQDPIGLQIGGFRIVEFVARGGMGAIYKAKQLSLGRYVALKMIPAALRDSMRVRRLLVEARAIARLEHPNIVQVYDVGYEKGYFFMAMQFLRGSTLKERLAELGRLPIQEALDIARDVARGLEAAHAMGIVHRDIKPSNIIVTEDGRARLTDFGLALMTESKDDLGEFVVGTPGFMSPEQYLGRPVDGRSDIYSLGVVLYFLVTGQSPFPGDTPQAVRQAQLEGRPRAPRALNPDVSEGLQAILAKMMARAPEKRYPGAGAFLEDLERIIRGEDPKAIVETGRFVKCGFCEAVNPGRSQRCGVCGEPLASGAPRKLELGLHPGEFLCRGCGTPNRRGSRVCAGCRKRFCPSCGDRPLERGKRCVCGAAPP